MPSKPISPAQRRVLDRLATPGTTLCEGPLGWYVDEWRRSRVDVRAAVVERLKAAGWIKAFVGGWWVISDLGRAVLAAGEREGEA